MDEPTLRVIHTTLAAQKSDIGAREVDDLLPRIKAFIEEKGCLPSLSSQDGMERRMAEAMAWMDNQNRKKPQG